MKRPQRQRRTTQYGFTLLELILALAITLLLMGSLWQTLQLTAHFEQGPSADETAGRLVQGLSQVLKQDLLSLRVPAPTITTGLSQLDSLDSSPRSQVAAQSDSQKTHSSPARQLIGSPQGFVMLRPTIDQQWELVSYRTPLTPLSVDFFWTYRGSTRPVSVTLSRAPEGLTRDTRPLSTTGELLPISEPPSNSATLHSSRSSHSSRQQQVNGQWHIPEVQSLRCRYFDGRSWQPQWKMENNEQLPAAIELEVTCIGSTPRRIVLRLADEFAADLLTERGVTP